MVASCPKGDGATRWIGWLRPTTEVEEGLRVGIGWYLRTDLEDPYFEKLEAGEPAERFKETVEKVLSAGDLILYGVKD